MNYSIWLLTASYLVGAAPDDHLAPMPTQVTAVAAEPCCGDQGAAPGGRWHQGGGHAAADCCSEEKPARGSLFSRLRAMFHRSKGCDPCGEPCGDSCCGTAVPPVAHPVVSMPEPVVTPAPVPAAPVVKVVEATPASSSTEIAKEFLDKVGNAADYSWVTGELFYIHAAKGLWVVRYAPVDKEDRYGGSVVLASATNMDSFREGDLVTVHGEMLNEGRASKYLGGPLYRAITVHLDERGHQ